MQKCSEMDLLVLTTFVFFMFLLSFGGLMINKKEQALKMRVGRGLVPSDIRYNGSQLVYLVVFSLLGGWVSGALGLGGGTIFNPMMITLGVPPLVATSTAVYMIIYSSAASTVIYLSYGALDAYFAMWISFWCSIGIVVSVNIVEVIIKRYRRQSILVFVLAGVLAFSTTLVIY